MNWKSPEQKASQLSTSEASKIASATCGSGRGARLQHARELQSAPRGQTTNQWECNRGARGGRAEVGGCDLENKRHVAL
jgi:hypothetical protein